MATHETRYDAIIIGAGTSGLNVSRELSLAGMRVLCLEAGQRYDRHTYPRTEVDASAQLYWGGGVELTKDAGIGILRPKVVGGGSIVNQALMDRFDDIALDDFRADSGVEFMSLDAMTPYYERAENNVELQIVPETHRNGNAKIFAQGFAANGYEYAPLRRAQADCRYEDGNSCIECLGGCRIDSKQSTAITALPKAEAAGLELRSQMEARRVEEKSDHVRVTATDVRGGEHTFEATRLILASGAIGNTRLLLNSGFGQRHSALGTNFYSHPQFMNFGRFEEKIDAHRGPLQNYKSNDPGFRRQGFKLENVFGGAASIAMLMPGFGKEHLRRMRDITHYACVEVCIRDQHPGRITVNKAGYPVIEKTLDAEDQRRRAAGAAAIRNIFLSQGATEVIEGAVGIGLHLMGGCRIGVDDRTSVVGPDFKLHGSQRIWAADSSIFPNAPGINPALSIAAFSLRASDTILQEA